jgi:predicted house-cleaning noncanonical NTP pyrophosphatase (MazG superfamily)
MCNKLGRDKGLTSFKAQNVIPTYRLLKGEELGSALKDKLIEESQEVKEANNQQELISELADVLEVINGICKVYNISMNDIEPVKAQKYQERGGFEHGFYLEAVEMEENNSRIEHFRKSPEKYPEIKS